MPKTSVEVVSLPSTDSGEYYTIGDWFEIDDGVDVEYALLVAVSFGTDGAKVALVYPATGLRYTDPLSVDSFYKIPHGELFHEDDGIEVRKVSSVSITVDV